MPNQMGPLEVNCDAPPYNIVRACRMVGIQTPEDVRWSRLSEYVNAQANRRSILKHQSWKMILGLGQPTQGTCVCGQKLPILEHYTFTLLSGNQSSYFLGQCKRCFSVYWEEA